MVESMLYLDREFDEVLKNLKTLKWLPWIGQNYNYSKVLILGESYYEDGDDWLENNIHATRQLISKNINGNTVKILSNFEKVIFNMDTVSIEKSRELWKSVAYLNLVQRLMPTIKERPKDNDFDEGWAMFFQLVKILRPETCIVLGKSSCGRLGYYLNNNRTTWNRNISEFYEFDKVINLSNKDQSMKLIFINHPSGSYGFNYKVWSDLIRKNKPEIEFLIKK